MNNGANLVEEADKALDDLVEHAEAAVDGVIAQPSVTDHMLTEIAGELLARHAFISEVDMLRHRKAYNAELSNAVEFLAKAQGSVHRYLKERQRDNNYGQDNVL